MNNQNYLNPGKEKFNLDRMNMDDNKTPYPMNESCWVLYI